MFDTIEELNRHYRTFIIDMCKGTKIKPWECVLRLSQSGELVGFQKHPDFTYHFEAKFAVKIIEGIPAFVGNIFFYDTIEVMIESSDPYGNIYIIPTSKIPTRRPIDCFWCEHIEKLSRKKTEPKQTEIKLSAAEIQSGSSRVKWAEGLILQLPNSHDGRNSWLLNYGHSEQAKYLRERHPDLKFDEERDCFIQDAS